MTNVKTNMGLHHKKINDLMPFANNSRTHTEEQVLQICASIKEFGFTNPILIDESNTIIAGHGRVMAARNLGINSVPCVTLDKLTDTQKKAYVIADNKLALNAGWNEDLLRIELEGLQDLDFDISVIGFSDDELNDIMPPEEVQGLTDEDAIPEDVEPAAKLGDLWILGEHRLLCGDSTDIKQVERLMDGEKADMVFTDPPYLHLNMSPLNGAFKDRPSFKKLVNSDNLNSFEPSSFFSILTILEADTIYCFTSQKLLNDYIKYFDELDRKWDLLVMGKKNPIPLKNNTFLSDLEWLFFSRRSGAYFNSKEDYKYYYKYRQISVKPSKYGHPTEKQICYIEPYIKISSPPKGIIVDLFSGAGSTLIACEKTNRKCYGMELDPHYCDVIIKRWEDYTGNKAVLSE